MPHRPLSDFVPTEQIRQMAHTTRRYCGPSALAFSPDARTLAYVSDRSGTYCAWTIPVAGGQPAQALAVDGGAVRSLDRAKLTERSPITHLDNVRCPMLVLQGANDPRVPKSESDQVVERLRARGQRVEYVVFPDEGHGFTKRKNQDAAYEKIVDFLTTELVG